MAKRKRPKKIKCADTRPAKQSPEAQHRPGRVSEKRKMLEKYGKQAFLLPEGTPSSPGVPSFPLISKKTGCFHCGMMRMSYTRLGAAMNATKNKAYKADLRLARQRLIKKALEFADKADKTNRCNWAFRARKRYPPW